MSEAKQDIQGLFCEALEKGSPEELWHFLDAACGDDAELRDHLEDLLESHREAANFLGGATPDEATWNMPGVTETIGTQIGPYKLREQIGEGGMGVVYMAEQQQPVRRMVALKVIKPGTDTKEVIARFDAERHALALMDHPNIARIIDAGTTETGRPYFVMDLVKGIPITKYCDQQQHDPRQRIASGSGADNGRVDRTGTTATGSGSDRWNCKMTSRRKKIVLAHRDPDRVPIGRTGPGTERVDRRSKGPASRGCPRSWESVTAWCA